MELLNSILNEAGLLLVLIDYETACVVDCNQAQCEAAGRRRDEMVGRHASELHVSFPLNTREQFEYLVSSVEKTPGLAIETKYRHKDGWFYPVRVECFKQEFNGRAYLLVAARRSLGQPPVQSRHEREARWQKALFQIASHPAVASGGFPAAAEFAALTGQSVFPADHCTIWRLDDEQKIHFEADHRGGMRPGLEQPIDLAEYPWLNAALVSGRATDLFSACPAGLELEKTRAFAAGFDAAAVLCAPIRTGGKTWGAVTVSSKSARQWQPEEVVFAAELADQVANAVLSAERRRVEEELRTSQQRYRNFIEFSAEAVWRVEFTEPVSMDQPVDDLIAALLQCGYLAECNDAFARFFDSTDYRQFIGMPLSKLLAPFDEARMAELRATAQAGFRLENLEARHIVNGQERWVLRNAKGIFSERRLVQFWGASRDITARKRAEQLLLESEQRYRAFVANSSEGIFRIEYSQPIPMSLAPAEIVKRTWETGILAECNEAYARMRGYQRLEELVGRLSIELRMPSPEEFQQDLDFLRDGCRIVDMERTARMKDGTLRWFSYSVTGIVENDCLTRIWGRVADITARRALEEELRALSARRASTLEQERARIAREIHDELGQQLTALKFEAAALERSARMPAKGELTKSIDEAIQTVRRIATELRPAILDHFGLVAAMEWLANEVSRRTGLECDCELEPELTVERGLATTVFRIFQEALTNAARHSEARLVQVHLKIRNERLELTIQDNGKGIGPGDESRPSLGLVGMRERAREAGGAVTITGAPGSGTRVSVWFPFPAVRPGGAE